MSDSGRWEHSRDQDDRHSQPRSDTRRIEPTRDTRDRIADIDSDRDISNNPSLHVTSLSFDVSSFEDINSRFQGFYQGAHHTMADHCIP